MKLGLGTAQFGLDYGISNTRGKVSLEEAGLILDVARAAGMDLIDTAPSYGDSEASLGKLLQGSTDFRIMTKTLPMKGAPLTPQRVKEIERTFSNSLAHLSAKSLYGLLVHHAEDLLGPGGELLIESLRNLQSRKWVHKIGVSVYNARQIDGILKLFTPDLIQVPLNVFDQRLLQSGHLRSLKKQGIEIHARSIFLQGLLLMEPNTIHPYFSGVRSHFSRYRDFLIQEGLTPLETAVQFVLQHPEIDSAIVGVAAASELQQIIDACRKRPRHADIWETFAVSDESVLNPSLWRVS